jgi:hypothetical protein
MDTHSLEVPTSVHLIAAVYHAAETARHAVVATVHALSMAEKAALSTEIAEDQVDNHQRKIFIHRHIYRQLSKRI